MICTWTCVLPAIRFIPVCRNWPTRPAVSTNSVRNTASLRKNNRSPVADHSARASSEGALARFASLSRLLCFVLVLHGGGVAAAECGGDRVDAEVTVDHVYDGDTVRLHGGRHVRLIGLATHELGRAGAADQPHAGAAREALRQRLGAAAALTLRYAVVFRVVFGCC